MNYFVWAIILLLQSFSFTLVSRARNSNNLVYNVLASVLSNGIWIGAQFILIDNIIKILKESNIEKGIAIAIFYIICTTAGSVISQWMCLKYWEK